MKLSSFMLILAGFWVGYERIIEWLINWLEMIRDKPKKSDESKKKDKITNKVLKGYRGFVDKAQDDLDKDYQEYYDLQDDPVKNKDKIEALKIEMEKQDEIVKKAYEAYNRRRKYMVMSTEEEIEKWWIKFLKSLLPFLIAWITWAIICSISTISFISVFQESMLIESVDITILWIDRLLLTPILFAGGPDVFHKFMSLIQTIKEEKETAIKQMSADIIVSKEKP